MSNKLDLLELTMDIMELRALELTDEDISGYVEFFSKTYHLESSEIN